MGVAGHVMKCTLGIPSQTGLAPEAKSSCQIDLRPSVKTPSAIGLAPEAKSSCQIDLRPNVKTTCAIGLVAKAKSCSHTERKNVPHGNF